MLHDVGHSPFSHSGENFFIDESKSLYDKLVDIVNNSQFSSDVDYYNNKPAAPHEIMSVVVALKQFDSFLMTVILTMRLKVFLLVVLLVTNIEMLIKM